jgi:hypothetical protein
MDRRPPLRRHLLLRQPRDLRTAGRLFVAVYRGLFFQQPSLQMELGLREAA